MKVFGRHGCTRGPPDPSSEVEAMQLSFAQHEGL